MTWSRGLTARSSNGWSPSHVGQQLTHERSLLDEEDAENTGVGEAAAQEVVPAKTADEGREDKSHSVDARSGSSRCSQTTTASSFRSGDRRFGRFGGGSA